jgi:carbonic anhydrase
MAFQLFEPHLDLGLRRLLPEWRRLVTTEHLRQDVISGVTVACVAVPLSLAIALASGVAPGVGLVTAIIAGIVCAIFGGTPLAVSGPAAAMAVLVATIVEKQGLAVLLCIGLICGLLQLLTGALGLGKIIRLVPVSVVEGFTAGIGAIILIGQLPRVLGLPPPPESHVVDVLTHIRDLIHEANPTSVIVALVTVGIVVGLPRISPRIPAPLLGVLLPTIAVVALGLKTAEIGEIPNSLPPLRIPELPAADAWGSIVGSAFVVYALASLETLLSSSAVDKLSRGQRHDPDQELIGQGLGNIASSLVGGIPVTGVIARSALNVQAGAKTRRSAIIHSMVLISTVFLLGPYMARIPIAALAGVLVSVALRMLSPAKVRMLWQVSRADTAVYFLTFSVIVGVGLLQGVQWGVVGALIIAAVRLGQTHTRVFVTAPSETGRLELAGPVTFLSSLEFEKLRAHIEQMPVGSRAVFQLTGVTIMDATGAEMVVDLIGTIKARDIKVAVWVTDPDICQRLKNADHTGVLEGSMAQSQHEIVQILETQAPLSARQRLLFGVEHYRRVLFPKYARLFENLAEKQTPHTLFITCSDSRLQPSLLTSSDPGELFIVRNVGNMVPRFSEQNPPSGGGGIEYALGVLNVEQIVVCAHSRCGAIQALMKPSEVPAHLRSLCAWLEQVEAGELCGKLPSGISQDDTARINALLQLDHLRTYPLVRERLEANSLRLSAWFFDVAKGEIEEYFPELEKWLPAGVAVSTFPSAASEPPGRTTEPPLVNAHKPELGAA